MRPTRFPGGEHPSDDTARGCLYGTRCQLVPYIGQRIHEHKRAVQQRHWSANVGHGHHVVDIISNSMVRKQLTFEHGVQEQTSCSTGSGHADGSNRKLPYLLPLRFDRFIFGVRLYRTTIISVSTVLRFYHNVTLPGTGDQRP